MTYFYYDTTKITHKEFESLEVIDGYRTLPNGAKIGDYAKIGDKATIESYAIIGDKAKIGDKAIIESYATIWDNAKIGDNAKIESYTTIWDNARIGDKATIWDNATIGVNARIGKTTTIGYYAKIGDKAIIGDYAIIGSYATIGKNARIGNNTRVLNFASLQIRGKWLVHIYEVGKIRCGRFIGTYDKLINRTQSEWDKHGYTDSEIATIKSFTEYLRDNESMFVEATQKPVGKCNE